MHSLSTLLTALTLAALLPTRHAHGVMNWPCVRGALASRARFIPKGVDDTAPIDWLMHFPAGARDINVDRPGLRSQMAAADRRGWIPFEPLDPTFQWRAGVCGDKKSRDDHLRGGKFYHDATIVESYPQAGVIDVGLSIVEHHNGFMELHVCNVEECGGEISEKCFRRGHCKQLQRAPNPICDSGFSKKCGPIDSNYPGRWYLPCSTIPMHSDGWETYGRGTILYQLPKYLRCKHCVLQWFWTAANSCSPPGVIEYFTGPDRPRNWGNCEGQGGARGGFTDTQQPCGRGRFPEEYLQCADIAIERLPASDGDDGDAGGLKKPTPVSPPVKPTPSASASASAMPTPSPSASESAAPSMSATVTPTPKAVEKEERKPRARRLPKASTSPTPSMSVSPTASASSSAEPSASATPSASVIEAADDGPEASDEVMESLKPTEEDTEDEDDVAEPPVVTRAPPTRTVATVAAGSTAVVAGSTTVTIVSATNARSDTTSPSGSGVGVPRGPVGAQDSYVPRKGGGNSGKAIVDIVLIGDGMRVASLNDERRVDISKFRWISVEAVVRAPVDMVKFVYDGRVTKDSGERFYMFGKSEDGRPVPWARPPVNVEVTLQVNGGGDWDRVSFILMR